MPSIAIEVSGPNNETLYFRPVGNVRGELDYLRCANSKAIDRARQGINPIPGQRIVYDTDAKVGCVEEPLWEERFAQLRAEIEKKGLKLPPQRQEFASADESTWLHWMRRACETGVAKLTTGKFPARLPGKPQTDFCFPARPKSDLVLATERQNELLAALIDKLSR